MLKPTTQHLVVADIHGQSGTIVQACFTFLLPMAQAAGSRTANVSIADDNVRPVNTFTAYVAACAAQQSFMSSPRRGPPSADVQQHCATCARVHFGSISAIHLQACLSPAERAVVRTMAQADAYDGPGRRGFMSLSTATGHRRQSIHAGP
eukprot:TRINITY_DN12496_c0_g1_i3.p2 TRINITY_DN12496_c0_g1~~TRINITY_DN12496_c0_g1_i3.p2  ORF type:complete len:150 (-),score=12.64 TRINITY_DN12496_c0_g1_i3:285-734(-)